MLEIAKALALTFWQAISSEQHQAVDTLLLSYFYFNLIIKMCYLFIYLFRYLHNYHILSQINFELPHTALLL